MKSHTVLWVMVLAGFAAPGYAQPMGAAARDAVLQECRAIGSDSERLECYDKALDRIYGVDEQLEAKRRELRRGRFGLPIDSNGLALTELEATVTEVDEDLRTRRVFIALDNGQVWQLLSSGGLRTKITPGERVVITESGTGGYRLRMPQKTGFRGVKRVR